MQPNSEDFRLYTKEPPRQILHEDFKSIPELPIDGGWGYDKENAVIINKNDPIVDHSMPFDGIGIEYIFVEKRTFEELIIFRPKGQKFIFIDKKLIQQRTIIEGDNRYDHLTFKISAVPESLEFASKTKQDTGRIYYVSDFWFDITSFFNRTR